MRSQALEPDPRIDREANFSKVYGGGAVFCAPVNQSGKPTLVGDTEKQVLGDA